ncbi:MAG: LCP family protein [Acutalibacteraceae bacterium]
MGKRKSKKQNIIRYSLIVLLAVLVVAGGLLFLQKWEKEQSRFAETEVEETTVSYNGKDYTLKDNVETFLVIGLDKYEMPQDAESYNNDQQADFLMLLVFDNDSQKCTAIHINRDTMADVNILGVNGNKVDTVVRQIALAHTQGNGRDVSCHNTADAVSNLLLGVKINQYMSVTMDAVSIFNDLVGGVEVEIQDDFTGVDDTLIKGQKVLLKGEHALNFVRSRKGLEDSTNSTRMKRQRQYIEALYQKALQSMNNDEDFIAKAYAKVSDYTVTDRSVTQLQNLAKKFSGYEFSQIISFDGETKTEDGHIAFYPDENEIKKAVIGLFYEPVN